MQREANKMTKDIITQPEYVTQEHLEFLDELRESGVTNMYGATSYLVDEFDIEEKIARQVLTYWMKTFGVRHPVQGTKA